MKELIMLGALALFMWLISRWLGPPVRRQPGADGRSGPNPEADLLPPDVPITFDSTGSGDA